MTIIVFYLFAAILLLAALRVITAKNPVHASLSLVLAFFTGAALWMLMEAEFLAITLVLVYVGAVMVLFLFVVMMLDINFEALREGFWNYFPFAGVIAAIMASEMAFVFIVKDTGLADKIDVVPLAHGISNIKQLGVPIYTDYLLPFELAAVVLLVAIIAAISLTLRKRKNTKYIDPSDQIKVKAVDRVRILKIKSVIPVNSDNLKTPESD
jgi:NADH-quinone oxidoreductase subunit J